MFLETSITLCYVPIVIDPLRHFVLVAEAGSFTAAARRAHLTQPALTAAIRRLEGALGARLFVRGRTGAEPTEAGKALLPHARAALVAVDDGRRAVAEVEGMSVGAVRVGAGSTAVTYLLPGIVSAFRKRHPAVSLSLAELYNDALLLEVDAGRLDLAIVTGPVPGGEPWLLDELVLVHAPGIDPKTLPFLTLARGAATRTLLDRHFPGVPIALELASLSGVKGQVRAGLGVALVSRLAVATDLSLGRLVEWKRAALPIRRELALLHRGVERLSPATRALRDMLFAQPRALPQRRRRAP
jgi:DNA-binding transcriptional LysR family regulator